MAEILVKATAAWTDDPTIIAHQYGDIIAVRDDGFEWGASECLPDFIVFKLPGVAASDLNLEGAVFTQPTDGTPPQLVQAARYQIPQDAMDAAVQSGETAQDVSQSAGQSNNQMGRQIQLAAQMGGDTPDAPDFSDFLGAIIDKGTSS